MRQDTGLDKVTVEASTSVWASSEAHVQVSDDHLSLVGLYICSTGMHFTPTLAVQQARLPKKLLVCNAWCQPVQSD